MTSSRWSVPGGGEGSSSRDAAAPSAPPPGSRPASALLTAPSAASSMPPPSPPPPATGPYPPAAAVTMYPTPNYAPAQTWRTGDSGASGSGGGGSGPKPVIYMQHGYPVVIHCETDLPSRSASSDPAAAAPAAPPAHGTPVTTVTGPPGSPVRSPLAGPGFGTVPGIAVGAAGASPLSARHAGGALALQHPPRPDSDRERQAQRHMLQMANWLVPDPARRHDALFSSFILLGMFCVFAFMAGDYSFWLRTPGGIASGAPPPPLEQTPWGPRALLKWVTFWRMSAETTFAPPYLFTWGARYTPAIKAGQWWRLFSSFCLHSSLPHILSNLVLFALLAVPLEHAYGPLRIGIIFLASAFSANFMSMAFEDPCVLYVGASGAVFGFVGLALSDLLLNWDAVRAPFVRLVIMLAMLGVTIAVEYLELPYAGVAGGRVSHLSHVGGLLGGLFVSFAFLPNLKDRRFRAVRSFVRDHWGTRLPRAAPREHPGLTSCWKRNRCLHALALTVCAAAVLFLFAALPVYVWLWKLPRLDCPAVPGLV